MDTRTVSSQSVNTLNVRMQAIGIRSIVQAKDLRTSGGTGLAVYRILRNVIEPTYQEISVALYVECTYVVLIISK